MFVSVWFLSATLKLYAINVQCIRCAGGNHLHILALKVPLKEHLVTCLEL